jgi:MraZ protein
VARRFRGETTCKVDAKGRFFLPPLFRRAVEDGDPNFQPGSKPELVIVYGDVSFDYLEGYTVAAMAQLDAKIDRLQSSALKRQLERIYTGLAQPVEVDNDGRILLTPKMREKLGIEGEIYLIASGRTFKIWRKEVYDGKYAEDLAEGLPEGVDLLDAMDAELAKLDAG